MIGFHSPLVLKKVSEMSIYVFNLKIPDRYWMPGAGFAFDKYPGSGSAKKFWAVSG
jgi:hypothetical protein